jgi:hypothetical protein
LIDRWANFCLAVLGGIILIPQIRVDGQEYPILIIVVVT